MFGTVFSEVYATRRVFHIVFNTSSILVELSKCLFLRLVRHNAFGRPLCCEYSCPLISPVNSSTTDASIALDRFRTVNTNRLALENLENSLVPRATQQFAFVVRIFCLRYRLRIHKINTGKNRVGSGCGTKRFEHGSRVVKRIQRFRRQDAFGDS